MILVDPWLVEELVFAGQNWLYRGKKTHIPPQDPAKVAEGIDAIILSQVHPHWPLRVTHLSMCLPSGRLTIIPFLYAPYFKLSFG